jgi:hypothetical protein
VALLSFAGATAADSGSVEGSEEEEEDVATFSLL